MHTNTHAKKTAGRGPALLIGALVGALALGAGGAALADGAPGPGFLPRGMFRLLGALDLTEAQEVKLVRIRRAMRKEAEAARVEIHGSLAPAFAELEKPAPDPAKLHGLIDDVSRRMSAIAHKAVDQYLELHATLTPEQRKTLVEQSRRIHADGKKERRQRFERDN